MTSLQTRKAQLAAALTTLQLPPTLQFRSWTEEDFPAIEHLSTRQGWSTPHTRPQEALLAWQQSWPALIATDAERVVGFVRGITDGEITTYIAELFVDPEYRGQGIGRLLLNTCHASTPTRDSTSFQPRRPFHFIKPLAFGM